jgi:pantoate kinase
MESAAAFAPANLSLVFETYDAAPPHGRGSRGVGITLTEGVRVEVTRAAGRDTEIMVAGEAWEFPTVRSVVHELAPEPVRIEIAAAFPFGCGFGMSGASALAVAFAVDRLFGIGYSPSVLAMTAHRAEVQHATGLGDVGGQFNGGIMVKRKRYEPLLVEQLPVETEELHVRIFGPILTSSVINSREKLEHINRAGHAAMAEIGEAGDDLDMEGLLHISRRFAEESGLLQSERLREAIDGAGRLGHAASMVMLGEAMVATGPFPGSRKVTVHRGGVRVEE